jgi:hypothetical protein
MHHSLRRSLLAPLLIGGLACSSGSGLPQGSSGGASTSGGSASGGRSGTAGSGFASSGASGGSSLGGAFENGGTVGSGGVAGIGSGGVAGIGSGAAGSGEGGAIAGPGGQAGMSSGGQATAGAGAIGDLDELYEAEAIPPNQIFGFAQNTKCTPMCTKPLTVGANCCSGSGQVTWIVSENGAHPAGWMQFNAISAPANASYDVTFWYHCGLSDTYGAGNCGGQAMTEPKQTGCRPHVFTVNGTVLPGGYHFPCFPGSWNTIYAATVSLPLAAGMNTIKVAAPPPRDAVDVDAIEILPPGKGHAPLIAANTDLLGENN